MQSRLTCARQAAKIADVYRERGAGIATDYLSVRSDLREIFRKERTARSDKFWCDSSERREAKTEGACGYLLYSSMQNVKERRQGKKIRRTLLEEVTIAVGVATRNR